MMKVYCITLDDEEEVSVGAVDWFFSETERDAKAALYLTNPPIARSCALFTISISPSLWMRARIGSDAAHAEITDLVDELMWNREYKSLVTGYMERAA